MWQPEKLTRQMARFEARPELGLCVTHVQNFWIPELQEEAERLRNHPLSQVQPGYILQTLLARRAVFETVGQFNTMLSHTEDTDWFLRAVEQVIVMEVLPEVLVYRRLHQTNMSRNEAASRESLLRVTKASLDRRRHRDGSTPRPCTLPASDQRGKE